MSEGDFILWFKNLRLSDVPRVGGKNAALGEMIGTLSSMGIRVPDGFALTADAYRHFLDEANLSSEIHEILKDLNTSKIADLKKRGAQIRKLILQATFPLSVSETLRKAYQDLGKMYGENLSVAVRSSATAEDLPGASFAGQQETFLNVSGEKVVLEATKKCIASLFTDRAISYRVDKGFSHEDVALSVGVQRMIRSDLASSGVMFSIDTETGLNKVVIIDSSYGLGGTIVQGKVTPDEFIVFKQGIKEGRSAIIARDLGSKDKKMIYARGGTKTVSVPKDLKNRYSLSDDEIKTLASWAITIEEHFSKLHGAYQPMDIEWAKDGKTSELFIIQARPETIHAAKRENVYSEYRLSEKKEPLLKGIAIGTKIAHGAPHVIKSAKEIELFKEGEILVTEITDPDWEPIMKIAGAIVTNRGGRTSHAAIVSRELGIPAVAGTINATKILKREKAVTVDCSSGKEGVIYSGALSFEKEEHHLDAIPQTKTKLMVNIGSPEEAFKNHYLPVSGVGLGRLEFIINSCIQIHPNALIHYEELKKSTDPRARKIFPEIERRTRGYADKTQFYVEELAEGIAKIGVAFFPHPVIIRFSDFKTNEYRALIGGELYELSEANPMLGWRGASRYYDPLFKEAFGLECRAIKKVRKEMGVTNVQVMVPFCRTVSEAEKVLATMKEYGLDREHDRGLKTYVMCEIPSNVLLADDFLELFDGMSIGSNDLTQLTLGIDRDSEKVASISNENDSAVKMLIRTVIQKCKEKGKYVGICGQAPTDFPDFTKFLVREGIESISLSPDTIIRTTLMIAEEERNIAS